MSNPPMTPEEFRARLAQMTAAELAAAHRDPVLRACIDAGPEHAAAWKEAVALHAALEAFEVPAPRANIAARTMAAIAAEERSRRRPSATARVRDLFAARTAVPAWGVAAALAVLAGSAGLNVALLNSRHEKGIASAADPQTPGAIVVYAPADSPTQAIPASAHGALPLLPTGATPALVVIMGAPPPTQMPAMQRPATINDVVHRKDSSI